MDLADGLFYEALMGNGGGSYVSTIELTIDNSLNVPVTIKGIPIVYSDTIYLEFQVLANSTEIYKLANYGEGIIIDDSDLLDSIVVSGGGSWAYDVYGATLAYGQYHITQPTMISIYKMN